MRRANFHESAVFWCALAGSLVVVGGVLIGIGVARTPTHGSVWSSGWFVAGAAFLVAGLFGLAWSLVLHLAHGQSGRLEPEAESEQKRVRADPQAEWRPPVEPNALARYLDDVNRTMAEHGFGPGGSAQPAEVAEPKEPTPSWEALNQFRVERYERNHGLFLVHEWVPSDDDGQVVDVRLRVTQHGDGPLSHGEIRVVEYSLGPKFTNHSLVCTSANDDYAISVSMWGPMLCVAKVYFRDERPPVVLERYVNFADKRGGEPGERHNAAHVAGKVGLTGQLQELLRRGRRIRASATVSSDGSSGLIEMWEQEVAIALEDAGRNDLLVRFERREYSDSARGVISGVWATRTRMGRKIALVSEFVRELGLPSPSAGPTQGN